MKRTTIILVLVLTLSLLSGCAADQKENTAAVSGTEIQFSDGKLTASSTGGVTIDGTALTITAPGTYVLSGNCTDGSVTVEKGTDGVTLVLNGLTLTCENSAPILCGKGSEVTIEAAAGTENTLSDTAANNDETGSADAENAVIKCKDGSRVVLCGTGALTLRANGKNGIKSGSTTQDGEASLTIRDLTLTIDAPVNDAVNAEAALTVESGTLTLSAGDDALHCDYTLNIGAAGTDGPRITVTSCYEGLEGSTIDLTGGDVRLTDVDFAYVEGKDVLHDVSVYAEPGQKVAFVGATGAGKTTITNLINRFYDIADGKIRYDGININKIKKADLRRSLGLVLQETNLFTGTVMENIRYGRLDATDEECRAAARLAGADDFITRLPQGYDTLLTNNGANLSQGQRQLIAIARAAVADPPVMILDEATSSIDTRTEAIVQRGMDQLMEGRTVFVIAHRLSTVKNSDVIMVLDHGRIIERGSHEKLIAERGTYYQLYTGAFELE